MGNRLFFMILDGSARLDRNVSSETPVSDPLTVEFFLLIPQKLIDSLAIFGSRFLIEFIFLWWILKQMTEVNGFKKKLLWKISDKIWLMYSENSNLPESADRSDIVRKEYRDWLEFLERFKMPKLRIFGIPVYVLSKNGIMSGIFALLPILSTYLDINFISLGKQIINWLK